jgi:hypothetical protein
MPKSAHHHSKLPEQPGAGSAKTAVTRATGLAESAGRQFYGYLRRTKSPEVSQPWSDGAKRERGRAGTLRARGHRARPSEGLVSVLFKQTDRQTENIAGHAAACGSLRSSGWRLASVAAAGSRGKITGKTDLFPAQRRCVGRPCRG